MMVIFQICFKDIKDLLLLLLCTCIVSEYLQLRWKRLPVNRMLGSGSARLSPMEIDLLKRNRIK